MSDFPHLMNMPTAVSPALGKSAIWEGCIIAEQNVLPLSLSLSLDPSLSLSIPLSHYCGDHGKHSSFLCVVGKQVGLIAVPSCVNIR